MISTRPFWHADKHADRRPVLEARGRVKAALRRWFEAEGFTEVETACLQVSPGNETHLHAFETEFRTESGNARPLYLHTSPEFAMKKLLAAGERKIFSFAPVFRNGERSALHSPEFTMLEWYRAGEPYTALWDDCADLSRLALQAAGSSHLRHGRQTAPAGAPIATLTMAEAFDRYAGIDLHRSISPSGVDRTAFATDVADIGIRVAGDDSWSDLFSRVLVDRIEPALANSGRATILTEWPTHEAALARPTARDPRFAERFEFYACGVELANGFGELTDPHEQRRRFEAEMNEKKRIYGRSYPIDEDFLTALAQMPPAAGCALGFDRLVMLVTGASHIDQVQWTPVWSGS